MTKKLFIIASLLLGTAMNAYSAEDNSQTVDHGYTRASRKRSLSPLPEEGRKEGLSKIDLFKKSDRVTLKPLSYIKFGSQTEVSKELFDRERALLFFQKNVPYTYSFCLRDEPCTSNLDIKKQAHKIKIYKIVGDEINPLIEDVLEQFLKTDEKYKELAIDLLINLLHMGDKLFSEMALGV
jgi:hypothetical protein